MKPVLIVSIIVAGLLAGFVGAAAAVVLIGRERAATEHSAALERRAEAEAAIERASHAQPITPAEPSELRDQVLALAEQVQGLRADLDGLRSSLEREAAPTALTPLEIGVEQVAAVQRDAVVQILQEERDKEQQKRDEERKQREQQAIAERAARVAKELGMGPADERKLTEFLTVASAKRDEMFRSVRDGNFDRDAMRQNFEDLRAWSEAELTKTFGANLGGQIMSMQRDFRGDFGGGGGPPWQGQPGQGQSQGGNRGGG